MEKQILDLLVKINTNLEDTNNRLDNFEKEIKSEIKTLNTKIDKLDFKLNDGFETLEIKADELDIKLRKTNKRISDQLAETMEDIAKLKLQ